MNIDDIAKLAGVSKATVSRVLNHRPFVREETREKVWQVIRDMGFSPSIIARNLSLKRSQCIGVILPEIETGFYSELLKSMDLEATLRGYFLLVTFSHSARELGWGEKFLHSGMVEGLIVMMPEVSEVMVKNLMKWGRRVVVLNKKFSKPFVPTLNVDDVDASYQLVSHLLQHGYETVGIVTGPKENFDSQERLVGYMKALLDHGKKFDPSLVEEGDFTEISGYEAVERMSGRGKLPRAIFFSNDAMAIGGIRWLEKKGLSSVFAASDTFRAASIEQLGEHAKVNHSEMPIAYPLGAAAGGVETVQIPHQSGKGLLQQPRQLRLVLQPINRRRGDPAVAHGIPVVVVVQPAEIVAAEIRAEDAAVEFPVDSPSKCRLQPIAEHVVHFGQGHCRHRTTQIQGRIFRRGQDGLKRRRVGESLPRLVGAVMLRPGVMCRIQPTPLIANGGYGLGNGLEVFAVVPQRLGQRQQRKPAAPLEHRPLVRTAPAGAEIFGVHQVGQLGYRLAGNQRCPLQDLTDQPAVARPVGNLPPASAVADRWYRPGRGTGPQRGNYLL